MVTPPPPRVGTQWYGGTLLLKVFAVAVVGGLQPVQILLESQWILGRSVSRPDDGKYFPVTGAKQCTIPSDPKTCQKYPPCSFCWDFPEQNQKQSRNTFNTTFSPRRAAPEVFFPVGRGPLGRVVQLVVFFK